MKKYKSLMMKYKSFEDSALYGIDEKERIEWFKSLEDFVNDEYGRDDTTIISTLNKLKLSPMGVDEEFDIIQTLWEQSSFIDELLEENRKLQEELDKK